MTADTFGAKASLTTKEAAFTVFRLDALRGRASPRASERMPFSIRVSSIGPRNLDGELVTEADVRNLAAWHAPAPEDVELRLHAGVGHPPGLHGSARGGRPGLDARAR